MLVKGRILLALLLLPLLGGCADLTSTTPGKILPPAYAACPLEGKWSVQEELASEGHPGGDALDTAAELQFSREMVIMGSNVWNQPSYKVKKVNSRDYLQTRYIVLDGYLASINQAVEVVTVSADANYLGEFMKIDEATVVSFVQNKVLRLHKTADRADDPAAAAGLNTVNGNQDNNSGTSGVFLGLRIPADYDYIYKTVWIAADDQQLRPLLSRPDLFFPRRSGFWELQVIGGTNQEGAGLRAQNVAIKDDPAASKEGVQAPAASTRRPSLAVDYIGNNYAAIAWNDGDMEKLEVLPVDQLSSPLGISAADLLGEDGAAAYRSARQQARQTLYGQGITLTAEAGGEDNFGLTRRNGHWYLQGRINYHHHGIPEYLDFNINFIPPDSLVVYDTLYLSWQSIRDRVPNAVDAFTSPNKDIAVIRTNSKLYFFGLNGEHLDSVTLGEMDLPEGTRIIMAEWATGFYVDDWEKAFVNHGAASL